ncbi:hypothetical protein [Mycolicibacterium vinylchloridicum]|uniref:hypothetical protein n=1 Tax=Mycolicibacterium vinylchloridicum TaxID=2736928 RepID=UPI0015CADBC9|nr:hypothetical protein [Mycolicibacterium vinylchloridicum]
MDDSDYDDVRERLVIEGLMDAISVGEIHSAFLFDNHEPKRSVSEAQQLTLRMIRDLVGEGLFVLGVPTRHGSFNAWDVPLDEAMAQIEAAYIDNFDDRWGWVCAAWLDQTDKGKELALQLYYADEPDDTDTQANPG